MLEKKHHVSKCFSIFFQLAKKHHPDINPDDPDAKAKFAKLAEAYEVTNAFLASLKFRICGGESLHLLFPLKRS